MEIINKFKTKTKRNKTKQKKNIYLLIVKMCADVPKRVNRASGVTIYRERK